MQPQRLKPRVFSRLFGKSETRALPGSHDSRHQLRSAISHKANRKTIGGVDRTYIASPRFLRNAGTSKSSCSKFAIMAVRMLSMETTSADADADDPEDPENDEARGDSITIDGESGSESKSSAPALTVNPADSVRL